MAELRRLDINIKANLGDTLSQINSVNKAMDQLVKSSQQANQALGGIGDGAKKAGVGIKEMTTAVVSGQAIYDFATRGAQAILNFGKSAIQASADLEQMKIGFTTMLGTATQASEFTRDLIEFAKKTPFELTGLRQASQQLLAYGFAQEEVLPNLKALGDIASGVGMEKLPNLILAFGQVRSATKLTGMELRQFTEAGVPLLEELSKGLGKSVADIKEMVSNGEIGFADVQKALMNLTGEGGRFNNLMEKQSKSLSGMISNLKDAWNIFLTELGDKGIRISKEIVGNLTNLVQNQLPKWLDAISKVLKTIYPIIQALLPFVSAFVTGVLAMKAFDVATKAVNALSIAFSTAGKALLTNPIGLAIAGITLALTGLKVAIDKNIGGLGTFFGKEFEEVKNAVGSISDEVVRNVVEASETINTTLGAMANGVAGNFGAMSGAITQNVNNLASTLKEQFQTMREEAQSALDYFSTIGLDQGLVSTGAEAITAVFDAQEKAVEDQKSKISELLDEMNGASIEKQEYLSQAIANITAGMAQEALENYSMLSEGAINQFDNLSNETELVALAQAEKLGEIAVEQYNTLLATNEEGLTAIANARDKAIEQGDKARADELTNILTQATIASTESARLAEERKNAVLQQEAELAEKQGMILVEATGEVISQGEYAKRWLKLLVSDMGNLLVIFGKAIFQAVAGIVKANINTIVFGVQNVINGIKKVIQAWKDVDNIKDAWEAVKTTGSEALKFFSGADFVAGGIEAWKDFGSEMKDVMTDTSKQIEPFIGKGNKYRDMILKDGVGSALKDAKDGADSLNKSLKAGAGADPFKAPTAGAKGLSEAEKKAKEEFADAEKVFKGNIDTLKKIQDLKDKLSRKSTTDVFGTVSTSSLDTTIAKQNQLKEVLGDTQSDLNDLTKDWEASYKDVNDAMSKLESDHKTKLNSLVNEITKVQEAITKLTSSFLQKQTESTAGLATDIASEIVKAEENIKKLNEDLAKEKDAERQNEIRKEIEKEQAIINGKQEAQAEYLKWVESVISQSETRLKEIKEKIAIEEDTDKKIQLLQEQAQIQKVLDEQGKMRTAIDTEVEKARKEAGATDLQRIILEFQEKMKAEQEQYDIQKQELIIRQTELEAMKAKEIELYETKKAEIEAYETEITNIFLANLTTREQAETASIDRLVAKYAELARARAEAGMSSFSAGGSTSPENPGFARGGYTGAGSLKDIAGIVHKGEYVIPKWLVSKMGGLVREIERIRSRGFEAGGFTSPVNNTTYQQPININANIQGNADFNAVSRYLAWQLRSNQ